MQYDTHKINFKKYVQDLYNENQKNLLGEIKEDPN